MRGVHQRPRGLAAGAATEGAPGRPFSPFGPGPSAPVEGKRTAGTRRLQSLAAGWTNGRCVRHSAGIPLGVVGCEALYPSGGDRYQSSALQGGEQAGESVFRHAGARIWAGYLAHESQGQRWCSHVRCCGTASRRPCRVDLSGVCGLFAARLPGWRAGAAVVLLGLRVASALKVWPRPT